MMNCPDTVELLAAALVDAAVLDQLGHSPGERQTAVWRRAAAEGVDGLLAARICAASPSAWAAVRGAARMTLAGAAAVEAVQRRELARVTSALHAVGVDALVLKGAAWAYTVYPSPDLRPRLDTDLLVGETGSHAAHGVLLGLGYVPAIESVMHTASAQRHYATADAQGVRHAVDLHWRATDRLAFAAALPFERLRARSVEVPALHNARTLGLVDAIEYASVHRIAHHGEQSRLLWIYDVHLLASALTAAGWADLMSDADRNGLRGCCARALDGCMRRFGARVPEMVREWVARGLADSMDPAFAGAGVLPIAAFVSDWRAASWRDRAALVRDHLFPDPAYMRARYGSRGPLGLAGAYIRRFARGAPRWLAR